MPHSSGQRQGDFRNRVEIPHSVSPRLIVYRSGAPGASSDSGTPAWEIFSAVWRWSSVTGKRGPDCWPHAGAARATTRNAKSVGPLHAGPSIGRPVAGAKDPRFIMLKAPPC